MSKHLQRSELRAKRFAKPRCLILGCGDVGMRLLPHLVERFRVYAVTSQAPGSVRFGQLRSAGVVPIYADLDKPHTLRKLSKLAKIVIHLAPPRSVGEIDLRTRHLAAILPEMSQVVYISTTGVYGDCQGAQFDETRTVSPVNARAKRRVSAENILRDWARRNSGRLSILRVPGIYAGDRLPIERLQKGMPALCVEDDVFTNHIHAEDLARLIFLSVFRARPNRVYHAVDDSDMKMAEYFDMVADHFALPRPPRLPRVELEKQVSPMLLSFMSESRRLTNSRIKRELGFALQFPTVADGLLVVDQAAGET